MPTRQLSITLLNHTDHDAEYLGQRHCLRLNYDDTVLQEAKKNERVTLSLDLPESSFTQRMLPLFEALYATHTSALPLPSKRAVDPDYDETLLTAYYHLLEHDPKRFLKLLGDVLIKAILMPEMTPKQKSNWQEPFLMIYELTNIRLYRKQTYIEANGLFITRETDSLDSFILKKSVLDYAALQTKLIAAFTERNPELNLRNLPILSVSDGIVVLQNAFWSYQKSNNGIRFTRQQDGVTVLVDHYFTFPHCFTLNRLFDYYYSQMLNISRKALLRALNELILDQTIRYLGYGMYQAMGKALPKP